MIERKFLKLRGVDSRNLMEGWGALDRVSERTENRIEEVRIDKTRELR